MCHHRYRPIERIAEPAAQRGPIRVSDADRERVVELLRAHASAGRLEPDELEERIEGAYRARYGSDLDAVLAELPAERAPRRPRDQARPSAPLFPLAVAALIAVAAITGVWWLLFAIWPLGIALGHRHHHRHHRGVRV
jgi:hypothetical protein